MNLEMELIKLPLDPGNKHNSIVADMAFVKQLDVGGQNFIIKQLVKVGPKNLEFVAKVDTRGNGDDYILGAIKANNLARTQGLPVPATTRFFYDQDGHPGLLMTNMSLSAQALIWGINQNFHEAELQTLMALNLSDDELSKDVPDSIKMLSEAASKANLFLSFDSYHLRRNKISKKLDVLLLDLTGETFNHGVDNIAYLDERNQFNSSLFLTFLRDRLAWCHNRELFARMEMYGQSLE